MLAISANRTLINFSNRRFCRKHGKIIDKNYINECDCLTINLVQPLIKYNQIQKKTSLYDLDSQELQAVIEQ